MESPYDEDYPKEEKDFEIDSQEIRGIALLAAASRPREHSDWTKDIEETIVLAKKYEEYIRTGDVTL